MRGGNQPSLTSSATNDVPQIQPGEKLSEFRARVDAEMPLSGISTGGKKLRFGKLREEPLTKHAKKLRKLQAAWRKEEARRKEKLEGEVEEMEENEELGGGMQKGISSSKRRGRTVEDDPWAQLAQARGRVSAGLHDVVQAPPKFDDVRRVRNGAAVMIANTPKGAGSLSKREDIGEERLELIKRYREMMKRHRNNGL